MACRLGDRERETEKKKEQGTGWRREREGEREGERNRGREGGREEGREGGGEGREGGREGVREAERESACAREPQPHRHFPQHHAPPPPKKKYSLTHTSTPSMTRRSVRDLRVTDTSAMQKFSDVSALVYLLHKVPIH
jgi:hypothetical protein